MNKIFPPRHAPSGVVPTPGERDALGASLVRPSKGRAVTAGQTPDTTKCVPSASRVPFMIGTHPEGRTEGRTVFAGQSVFRDHGPKIKGTRRDAPPTWGTVC